MSTRGLLTEPAGVTLVGAGSVMNLEASSGPAQATSGLDLGQLTREVLTRGRAELQGRHDAGAGGREIVRAYTLLMDRLVSMLFAATTQEYAPRLQRVKHRCAIMAQGGYGRRELSPYSDIDLVFLYPWKVTPYVEQVAQRILYSLWDTGLKVGHALRNPRVCVRFARRDTTVRTALLDARYICGDVSVFTEFTDAAQANLFSKQGSRFLQEKLEEARERQRRHGESVYVLQPHLKEGEGGLRDWHTALWMAKVKFKVRNFRDLTGLGVLTERDIDEFEVAQDFLWRLRNALHFTAGGYQDQLTFEYQDQIAAAFGYHDAASERGIERFMRTYYGHAAAVNRFSEALISRCVERSGRRSAIDRPARTVRPGMTIRGQTLAVTRRSVFRQTPVNLLRVFVEAQRHKVELSRVTKKYIREHLHLVDERLRDDPEAVGAFFDILQSRSRIYETLHEMHKQGVLIRFIPEFGHLLCRIQRDLYHIYTVDEHSLRGVRELERLRGGEYEQTCPLLTQVMREDDRSEILFLGMLFHDIGKGQGAEHSERGALLVREIATRLRLNRDDANQLEFLVRHHLLMAHLAQRRDIHDENLVLSFAKEVGDTSSLRKLYLLTFADMKAVGPNFWNNWRDMLLGDLYFRTLQMLDRGLLVEEDRAARVARIKDRLRQAPAKAGGERSLAAFLRSMPDSYFLTTPEESIPRHVILVERFRRAAASGSAVVKTAVRHVPKWDHSELTLCTTDRPGLFAMLAGVLAAAGLNVVRARIATSTDGTVLDEFLVSHVGRRESVLEEGRWERLTGTLEGALRGEIDVEALVNESRCPSILSRPRKSGPHAVTDVVVDNEVSRDYTVLDVYTEDRIGVLFTITNCLYRLGLQIHLAKITTTLQQVLDVFYVTDESGHKLEDPLGLERIKQVLTRRLHEEAAGSPRGG